MGRPRKEPLSELQKAAKAIGDDGEDVLKELESLDADGLNKRVAQASQAISDTEAELKESPEYVQAKDDVKLLSSGLREVKKRQRAIIKVCLQLRKDKGIA
jgi:hypothetical protein